MFKSPRFSLKSKEKILKIAQLGKNRKGNIRNQKLIF